MNWFNKLLRKPTRTISPLFELGFHGDTYLINYIDQLMPHIDNFIETGTNVGTTSNYVVHTYPQISIYSCEPDKEAYAVANKHLEAFNSRVHLYNIKSPDFLYDLHKEQLALRTSKNLYWLDAHGYGFKWPLDDEINFITKTIEQAIIIIDDAAVPNHPEFKYCAYDGQSCDYDYITKALSKNKTYTIVHPDYTEHTSKHHPLMGYMIIAFGGMEQYLPDSPSYSKQLFTA